jgi:hypothetical protein
MTRFRSLCLLSLLAPTLAFAWSPVAEQTPVSAKRGNFSLQLPPSWLYDLSGATVLASHDGVMLDQINVQLIPHANAFKAIKRSSTTDMSSEDLAEAYLANLQADGKLANFETLSTEPATLAGHPGFRVHVRFRLPPAQGDTVMDLTALGTALPEGLLIAFFRAPRLHFYDKWLPAFDQSVATLAITSAAKHP